MGSARRELHGIDRTRSKICFAGNHDVFQFFFVGFGIRSATEIHLLGAEEDDANCPAGTLRQASDQPGGAEGDGHASTVIGGAGARSQESRRPPMRTISSGWLLPLISPKTFQ
jgi:hypothetical protein